MKSSSCFISIVLALFSLTISAQPLTPEVVFKDNPQTHNMHIASDGQYLFTCNGGKSELGQITKFSFDGTKIESYKIDLDMRSLMYNSADKKLYVNTYGQKLYRIDNLQQSIYSEVFDFYDRSEQSAPAISENGKYIYFMEYGKVYIYSIKDRKLKKTLSGFESTDNAAGGGTTIAVDKNRIFVWNAGEQTIHIYSLKGKFQKSEKLSEGNYCFSLSLANGLLWVSEDGNYEDGTWFGYMVE
jgi:6-phosphogluconolactonase (cycloisomerase 2 family)